MPIHFIKSIFFSLLAIFIFGAYSCAPLKDFSENIKGPDSFSRTYGLIFSSFHPKLNSYLQDYAQRNKGNSFQIRLLGAKTVKWRGNLKIGVERENFLIEITATLVEQKRSRLEIKFLSPPSPGSASSLEKSASEFFHLIEKEMGLTPL